MGGPSLSASVRFCRDHTTGIASRLFDARPVFCFGLDSPLWQLGAPGRTLQAGIGLFPHLPDSRLTLRTGSNGVRATQPLASGGPAGLRCAADRTGDHSYDGLLAQARKGEPRRERSGSDRTGDPVESALELKSANRVAARPLSAPHLPLVPNKSPNPPTKHARYYKDIGVHNPGIQPNSGIIRHDRIRSPIIDHGDWCLLAACFILLHLFPEIFVLVPRRDCPTCPNRQSSNGEIQEPIRAGLPSDVEQ